MLWVLFCVLTLPLLVSIVSTFVLAIWLLYKNFKKNTVHALKHYPKVGVLVPHYNEKPQYLIQSLNAIETQDYPGQITVVLSDDGSCNDIQSYLKPWLAEKKNQHYISIQFEKNNGSKGKNMDAALPHFPDDTEVLVVVDSDTYLEKQSIRKVVERMWQDEKCAAVCGYIVPANEKKTFWQKLQYFEHISIYPVMKSAQDSMGVVTIMAGAFVAHRMSVVKDIGGWGEWIVEDIAWTWKALASGYSTGYCPDAVAYTYSPETKKDLSKQRRRWSRGRVEAYRTVLATSPLKALLFLPLFILYTLRLLPPLLCALPILTIYFQQWWIFSAILISLIVSFLTFKLYQTYLPKYLRTNMSDMARSSYYNSIFEVFLWHPTLLGFTDELFGKSKHWLTRQ